jgi:hypothetical protein
MSFEITSGEVNFLGNRIESMKMRLLISILLVLIYTCNSAAAQQRPFIWVTQADHTSIIEKIEKAPWAKASFDTLIAGLEADVQAHQQDPDKFLRAIPFDWDKAKLGETPPFFYTIHTLNGERRNLDNATDEEYANGKKYMAFLETAIECGVAFYLTEDEKYAQCATDILNASIKGIIQLEPSDWAGRGGWIFPDDILAESRRIGQHLPIIYDFIAPFIQNGGKPYDLGKKAKTDFPQGQAQEVFRTYADIVVNHGMINSNHPVLEASCLVYSALGLEDKNERDKYLKYYLTESTDNQDALNKVAVDYKEEGAVWPETSQYLNHVAGLTTRLMFVLDKYDSSLQLGQKYVNIPMALPVLDYLVYPNGEIIRWGDGHRNGKPLYYSYEEAYLLGKIDGIKKLTETFGPLINSAIEKRDYKREGLMALLWYDESIDSKTVNVELPRTDNVPHAGIFLQRNFTELNNTENGLMCFVGGAHMVHGHAEGMNIELYGKGQVLGVDNGRGKYQQDVHENYSRIFAAHNTVIVNGNSRGDGGWVNQGINTVQLIAMEPMPRKDAISPKYSFTQTSFVDDKGDKAEAIQERTLALIRTSETSGYYIDVFRSKSSLPNEFHDYLYHNIGDELRFLNDDLKIETTPERYMANASLPWTQNKLYRHPGWHFFQDVQSSSEYGKEVNARFSVEKLEGKSIFMDMHIPGFRNREYTKVLAPHTFEAPPPYDTLPTPTLVIRKKGEAWNEPFVVVYEPFDRHENNSSIVSVEKLGQKGIYKGLKIESTLDGQGLVQYVITQSKNQTYTNNRLDIEFKGTFGIVSLSADGKLLDLYIGEGELLRFGETILKPESDKNAAYMDYSK